jgi:hypothetical protein
MLKYYPWERKREEIMGKKFGAILPDSINIYGRRKIIMTGCSFT